VVAEETPALASLYNQQSAFAPQRTHLAVSAADDAAATTSEEAEADASDAEEVAEAALDERQAVLDPAWMVT